MLRSPLGPWVGYVVSASRVSPRHRAPRRTLSMSTCRDGCHGSKQEQAVATVYTRPLASSSNRAGGEKPAVFSRAPQGEERRPPVPGMPALEIRVTRYLSDNGSVS